MVGFIAEPTSEDCSTNHPPEFKLSIDPQSYKFDFELHLPEIDNLSLPVSENSFDFDSIKDWVEEMQDLDRGEVKIDDLDGLKEDSGTRTNGVEQCGVEKEGSKMIENDDCDEGKDSEVDLSEKLGDLGVSVEKEMEKVSLVGDPGVNWSTVEKNGVANESGSESESASSSASSSSSSSSSSGKSEVEEDEEEDKEVKMCEVKKEESEKKGELEEGEIMDSDADNMVCWSHDGDDDGDEDETDDGEEKFVLEVEDEDDDEGVTGGPIRSKNELKVLPPVPPVDVTLQPSHQMLPVGFILSIIGAQVIVEGTEKHNPLNEGSILWITESRSPLGRVDEIFGPVKTPYYIVRYNSETEVPSEIQQGTSVSFVPEFSEPILNNKNLYQKGYDASGDNDEEVLDELEFSDDEKEAEYKRMLKMSKRNSNEQGPGNKKNKKNFKNRDKRWKKAQPTASQEAAVLNSSEPTQVKQPTPAPVPPRNVGAHMGPARPSQLGPAATRPIPPLNLSSQLGPARPAQLGPTASRPIPPLNLGSQSGPTSSGPVPPFNLGSLSGPTSSGPVAPLNFGSQSGPMGTMPLNFGSQSRPTGTGPVVPMNLGTQLGLAGTGHVSPLNLNAQFGMNLGTQFGPAAMGPAPPLNLGTQFGPTSTGPVLPFGAQLGPGASGPVFPSGPIGALAFPQLNQAAALQMNGLLGNGLPFQHQNMLFSNGFQTNTVPWMQQSHPQAFQTPLTNVTPFQQQFDPTQIRPANNFLPLGPSNLNTGPSNLPFPGIFGPNVANQGLQNPNSQLPMIQGIFPPVSRPIENNAMQRPTSFSGNADASSLQFNQGSSFGRGRNQFHRRGGRFGGGRGRH